MFEVMNENGENHGAYETLDEARGAASFDRLTDYSIYANGQRVESHYSDDSMVLCPQCDDADPHCMFCNGYGEVTTVSANEWHRQNPALLTAVRA